MRSVSLPFEVGGKYQKKSWLGLGILFVYGIYAHQHTWRVSFRCELIGRRPAQLSPTSKSTNGIFFPSTWNSATEGLGSREVKVDLDGGANSLAARGFANRFASRRMELKPRVPPPDSERRSDSCLRFCAIDGCRHDERVDAVATAEKPKSSKSNERRMRQGAGEK